MVSACAGTRRMKLFSYAQNLLYQPFVIKAWHSPMRGCYGRLRLKCDGTRVETRFRLSTKRTSLFKSAGGVSSIDYWQPRCAHQQ